MRSGLLNHKIRGGTFQERPEGTSKHGIGYPVAQYFELHAAEVCVCVC